MDAKSGSAIDWETIARGILDYATPFEIPTSVEVVPNQFVLNRRTNLTGTLKIASSTTIGANAFENCKITGVIFPSNLVTINSNAFSSTELTGEIEFPNSLVTIGNNSFQVCKKITSIVIGSAVTTIKNFAFFNCDHLDTVVCNATTPPTMPANVFQGCTALANIYVPDASVSTYQSASGWSTYASIIKPISQRPT